MVKFMHKESKKVYNLLWWAGNLKFEWYAFEKDDKNTYFGFVMNNCWSVDEFGYFDISELAEAGVKHFAFKEEEFKTLMPPFGFVKVD